MDFHPIDRLLIHGSIVLLIGLLCGFPFWNAIIRGRQETAIRPWRVAHATLIPCGLVMLAVGIINPYLTLSDGLRSFMVWVLVASGYGFVFALVAGAGTGRRALTPRPLNIINILLFIGHLIGAVGSISGLSIVVYGLL